MIEEPVKLIVMTDRPRPTAAQIAAFQDTPTGFVVDAMFGRGALDRRIAPVGGHRHRVAGPALTAENQPADLLATLAALHFLQPGDVLIGGAQGWQGCAAAGDRVCGMARNGGAAGFVTDGPVRDLAGIEEVGLPCWATGLTPASPFTTGPGTVGGALQFGGLQVATGDMIVADSDGVVVVPIARIDAVIARLDQVRALEQALDAEVREGMRVPPAILDMLHSEATRHD
ncbi:RraA family protein [Maribius pontilimi]|uniref:Putative 4-hydroxy-4-methyl-2-oxoglutarate aldolase n=1 Tax=Palleronia pontilimi TaxID=1964209 RepID=A0A934MD51_9RHOB|nr:RraA family protein [Palleronia pontilimi]MBJ3763503.1 RraA family protein [Palleronia pontilimi]